MTASVAVVTGWLTNGVGMATGLLGQAGAPESRGTAGQGWSRVLQYKFHDNEVWRFLLLLGVIVVTLAVGRIARFVIERTSKRAAERAGMELTGAFLRCLARPVAVGVFAAGVYVGRFVLRFALQPDQPGFAKETFEMWGKVSQAVMALAGAYLIFRLVDIVEHYLKRWTSRTDTKLDDMLVPVIRKSLRVFIAVVAVLFIADNILGMKLGAVLAAAGVGGLAIALAAQDTLSNFFGSVSIFADRPFQVGERIRVGGFDGPVEEVGFRSTRIRTLEGHLVSVPNSKIANEMVENIGRRPFIRRVSNITVTYGAGPEKMDRAVAIIKEILSGIEEVNRGADLPPRVFFNDFNDWSLNILMIYWVHPPDYWMFQEVNQRVNLEMMRRFEEEGIQFAFPTQTLYLNKES